KFIFGIKVWNLDFIKFIFGIKVWDVGRVLSRNKKAPSSPNISGRVKLEFEGLKRSKTRFRPLNLESTSRWSKDEATGHGDQPQQASKGYKATMKFEDEASKLDDGVTT
ncbi:hypothetical protein SDJN02_09554, partial [Cucurbita argyrosperma subsp. argyrosperma]